MIVLHAAASDGRLFLWGEASSESSGVSSRRLGRPSKVRGMPSLSTDAEEEVS